MLVDGAIADLFLRDHQQLVAQPGWAWEDKEGKEQALRGLSEGFGFGFLLFFKDFVSFILPIFMTDTPLQDLALNTDSKQAS